jgi:hypothetical protein
MELPEPHHSRVAIEILKARQILQMYSGGDKSSGTALWYKATKPLKWTWNQLTFLYWDKYLPQDGHT